MKNPHINRVIGYIIMFIGFGVFYMGAHAGIASNGENEYNFFVLAIGIILVIASFVWMLFKVRCPHCNGILNLKLGNINVCPHCGKKTNI